MDFLIGGAAAIYGLIFLAMLFLELLGIGLDENSLPAPLNYLKALIAAALWPLTVLIYCLRDFLWPRDADGRRPAKPLNPWNVPGKHRPFVARPVKISESQRRALNGLEVDEDGLASFQDVLSEVFPQIGYHHPSRYGSYFMGIHGAPLAVEGLRTAIVEPNDYSYSSYRIHPDDVLTFFGRIIDHRGAI